MKSISADMVAPGDSSRNHKALIEKLGLERHCRYDADLSALTWLRVGGLAELLFQPSDEAELQYFLQRRPSDLPVFAMGVASNLLIRDGGVTGAIIRLGRGFNTIELLSDYQIRARAGMLDAVLAKKAAKAGIAGLEFLRSIPGSVGGAITMNAGCYGKEVKDVLIGARAMTFSGEILEFDHSQMGFSYRHCAAHDQGLVWLDAIFQGEPGRSQEIMAKMEEMLERREKTQPIKARTGGSTFKNPSSQLSSWQVIDRLGLRGVDHRGASFSNLHANFLINDGSADAAALEDLGELARNRAKAELDVALEWEIKRVGERS